MDKGKQGCQICKKKFGGVFSNEHQCKRCQRTICKQCCTKKKLMFTKNSLKLQQHRCCDSCLPQSQFISNYVKQNGSLSFGTLSKQGKQWSELSEIQIVESSRSHSGKNKVKIQFSNFQDVWSQMTPSLRELMGLSIVKIPTSNIQSTIRNITQKMYVPSNIGDSMINFIVYLLCHCDDTVTRKVLNYLLSISENVNQKSLQHNISTLCSELVPKIQQKLVKNLVNFIKSAYKSYVYNYFINSAQLDIVQHIVTQTLLYGDSQVLQMSLSCIIFQFRNHILFMKYDEKTLKNIIWQNLTLKNLQRSIKKLRKSLLKQASPKKQKQQQQKKAEQNKKQQKSISKLSQVLPDLKLQIKNQQQGYKIDEQKVLQKILEAEQFMKKMESGQLNQNQISIKDADQLERYLDLVIQQNDRSLKQCEQFEKLLASIQDQLYLSKNDRAKSNDKQQ